MTRGRDIDGHHPSGWGPPIAAGLAVAAYAAAWHAYGIFDVSDEGLLLVQAWRTLNGQSPYVDFHTGYGPLYFRLEALLLGAGGLPAVRWGLAAVHGAVGALLYALVRRMAGAGLAAAGVALLVAFALPVAGAQGAPFNVPYPGWYAGLAAVATALLLATRRPSVARVAAAGVLAGLVFAMKPNAGGLLAAGAAAAIVTGAGDGAGAGPVGWAVMALVALGSLLLVAPTGFSGSAFVLVPPVLGLAALGATRGVDDADAVPRLGVLGGGFVLAAAPLFAPVLSAIGPARFAREVLLVGAGVGAVYAVPMGWPATIAAAVGLAAFARAAWRTRRSPFVVAGVVAVAVAAAASASRAAAPAAAVRIGAEQAALALVPLALWGSLAVLRSGADGILAGPTAIAATAALQLYPRPDFAHLMPLAAVFVPLALGLWHRIGRLLPANAAAAVVVLPLALAAVRFVPTAALLARVARGDVTEVDVAGTRLAVEPAGADAIRALAAAAEAVGHASGPDERVLAFPACGAVLFFARRLPAGPHDYFHPGRPGRAEGAALAADLAAAPPPFAVTCSAAGSELAAAWDYYPELVGFLRSRYVPLFDRPPYAVLRSAR